MSKCKECRQKVLWVQRPDGGFFPPMDLPEDLRMTFSVQWDPETQNWVGGLAALPEPMELDLHNCPGRPVEPEAIQEHKEEVTQKSRAHDLMISRKLSVVCPSCGAKKQEWCTYVKEPDRLTTNLHARRHV